MDQLEEIKSKIDIVQIVNERMPLKRAGANFRALCPFHQEKTPSFYVSPSLQIFKCFGCGVGGDVIKFLQLYERMEFWEAVEYLARRAGVEIKKRTLSPQERQKKRLTSLLSYAVEFYHFLLTRHSIGEPARSYLAQRKILPKTITAFRLGFSPSKPDAVVQFLTKKGFSAEEMVAAGVVVKTPAGLIDRFRTRLVFPLCNHRGVVVGLSGRVIPGISPPDLAKYINTPETLIYKKGELLFGLDKTYRAIQNQGFAVVVEGEFDLLTPWQAGVENIVALKGTAFSATQAHLLSRFTQKVVLALDQDLAGSKAALRGVQVAEEAGLTVRVALFSGNKDPDELVRENPAKFRQAINHPLPVWDFVLRQAQTQVANQNLPLDEATKVILDSVLPWYVAIPNTVVRFRYFQKLAQVLGVPLETITTEAEKLVQSEESPKTSETEEPSSSLSRRELLEERLLSLVFTAKNPAEYLIDKNWQRLIKTLRFVRILEQAAKIAKEEKKFVLKNFVAQLPPELRPTFERLVLVPELEGWDSGLRQVEFQKIVCELRRLQLREHLVKLEEKIKKAEETGQEKNLGSLLARFSTLTRELKKLEEEAGKS